MKATKKSRTVGKTPIKLQWLIVGIMFAVLLAAIALLASGTMPGFPEASQKSLTLYTQSGADKLPVSLFIHPPVSRIQAEGDSSYQTLALQWTNHTVSRLTITVHSTDDCLLVIKPGDTAENATKEPVSTLIEPQRSTVQLLHLVARTSPSNDKHTCLGQRPLILQYSWTINDADLRTRLSAVFPTTQTVGGLTVLIPDVLFKPGQPTLGSADQASLAKVAEILKPYSDLKISAEGYTDATGSYVRNLELSRGRAAAVKQFLVNQGIASSRIVSNGFGPTSPIANNRTPSGRSRNRRVYLVLSKDVENQQSVSTGPIQITTSRRLNTERFFHLASVILLPALIPASLWLAGDWVRKTQDHRAAIQTRQERRLKRLQAKQDLDLEVWKAMLPIMTEGIRKHYIPTLSVLRNLLDETKEKLPDWQNILAYALLFRANISHMTKESSAFFFRNQDGEHLCAELTNILNERFYFMSEIKGQPDGFRKFVEKVEHDASMVSVKKKIRLALDPTDVQHAVCVAFKAATEIPGSLTQINKIATMLYAILDYETNAPFYPNWYGITPKFSQALSAKDLGLEDEGRISLETQIKAYTESSMYINQQKQAHNTEVQKHELAARRREPSDDGSPGKVT